MYTHVLPTYLSTYRIFKTHTFFILYYTIAAVNHQLSYRDFFWPSGAGAPVTDDGRAINHYTLGG